MFEVSMYKIVEAQVKIEVIIAKHHQQTSEGRVEAHINTRQPAATNPSLPTGPNEGDRKR